jgi:hypothetical protein
LATVDELLRHFERQVSLPWRDAAPEYRVWILHYDKALERRVRGRLSEFEVVARRHGHGWRVIDLAPLWARWITAHELFAGLVELPDELPGVLPDFSDHVAATVRHELSVCGPTDLLAIAGAGSLLGLSRVSSLIEKVAPQIPGRLLLLFPGRYDAGVYRLLDARDGWNYRATPVPA